MAKNENKEKENEKKEVETLPSGSRAMLLEHRLSLWRPFIRTSSNET
jgi:hypothetical protein